MSQGRKAAERLSGKTVCITGASSGIGKATAFEYLDASNGQAKLILCARRLDRLKELEKSIVEEHPGAKLYIGELDVANPEQVKRFFKGLPVDFQGIDILINNAGKAVGVDHVGSLQEEDVAAMFNTNVLGLIHVTQAVLPRMKDRGIGDIVNIGSIAGKFTYPGGSVYCASKHAVHAFTETLREELIDTSIRVIEIAPGLVNTEFSTVRYRGDTEKANEVYKGTDPLVAEDVADVIVYTTSRKPNTVVADVLLLPSCQATTPYLHRNR